MQKLKAIWICLCLTAVCLATTPSETDDSTRIIQAALQPSSLESDLRHLTDEVGGRVPGTPASELRCGVSNNLKNFSEQNPGGQWFGYDVDVCRTLAGYLGVTERIVGVDAGQEIKRLALGDFDVLITYRLQEMTTRQPSFLPWLAARLQISQPYVKTSKESNSYSWVLLSSDNIQLLRRIDQGLAKFSVSGDYRRIYKQSFQGVEPYPIDPWP